MLTDDVKDAMLGALSSGRAPNRIMLHTGTPGIDGTQNQVGSLTSATFDASSGGIRQLDADVLFSSLGANTQILYFSIWNSTGPTFLGSGQITTGDTVASSDGNYTLKATGTAITIP